MEAPLERGAVSPGTYCTRTYEECHRKPCRLQSPNYPGMYPRYSHSEYCAMLAIRFTFMFLLIH